MISATKDPMLLALYFLVDHVLVVYIDTQGHG